MINVEIELKTSQQLSELVNRVVSGREIITLTTDEQRKAVLLSLEVFEHLLGMYKYRQRELMPLESFQQGLHQALVEAGYDSREQIVNLVREVKQEIALEREQKTLLSGVEKAHQ